MQETFDIVINGGGMVGLALACGLQGSGLHVAVIECEPPKIVSSIAQPAVPRVSAINVASRLLLQHLQIWESIITQQKNPFLAIEVWEKDSFGHIFFNGTNLGYSELGYIVENMVIRQALWQRAEEIIDITIISPASLRQVVWEENKVCITLDNDRILTTSLVVAADGINSRVRAYANIPRVLWEYRHNALIATIRTTQPHGNIARQMFYGDGILAFLPLQNPYLSSIVWSLPSSVAQEYLIISKEAFNIKLAKTFNLVLGLCELQDKPQAFLLNAHYARNFIAPRLVLIGDAAHTIHPLAGQGVNLGFMDVALLLGEILHLHKSGKDIGYYPYLRNYEHNRKRSVLLMLLSIHGFSKIFSGQHLLKKIIRNAGLRLVDTLPSIKSYFIQQAMGLYDLPLWLTKNKLH